MYPDDVVARVEVIRTFLGSMEWKKAADLLNSGGGRIFIGVFNDTGLESSSTRWYLCGKGLLDITGSVERIHPIDINGGEQSEDIADGLLRRIAETFYKNYKTKTNHVSFLDIVREKIEDITYRPSDG